LSTKIFPARPNGFASSIRGQPTENVSLLFYL